ncbi:translation-associated GTPase [Rhodobacteraceae bacterium RKSG542]|uniref:translation-associated GTPase n=1 Tax=Pseudovibrio flavus TaxID=2529854 RepID=UPI0012BB8C4F|nr:translation-associated GTPase [Pseudovibrio flavus]MTI19002.1 translation-associated GTPase [Pseudovibrio flavus]
MSLRAILICLTSMLCWSLLIVTTRATMQAFALDPWIFTVVQIMCGGLFLILIGGRVRECWITITNPFTWGYGFLRVVSSACYTASLITVSAAVAGYFTFMAIPLSAAAVAYIFARPSAPMELYGHIIITIGLIMLVYGIEGTWANPAVIMMLFAEIAIVMATLMAEKHPQNQGDSSRSRATLSGVMLLASGAFFLIFLALGSFFSSGIGTDAQAGTWAASFPSLDLTQVWSSTLWLWAIAIGLTLRGAAMFMSMQAIRAAGSENYLAMAALLPLFALLFEMIAQHYGFITNGMPTPMTLAAGVIMTIGAFWIIIARRQKTKLKAQAA